MERPEPYVELFYDVDEGVLEIEANYSQYMEVPIKDPREVKDWIELFEVLGVIVHLYGEDDE